MDSATYPPIPAELNMNVDEAEIQEEENATRRSEPEVDTTNTNKRKDTSGPGGKAKRKQIPERSWVWDHYKKLQNDTSRCNCNYCGRLMACPTTSGTSNLSKHLKSCEKYLEIVQFQKQNKLNVEGQEDDGVVTYGRVTEAVFRDASNELLVLAQLPLSFIECLAWRQFCNKVKLYKPHSRRTATRDIVQMFVQKKEEMRNLIGDKRVSLTTDIWTAQPTAASYMVITAHWIDSNWRLRKIIIGFKNVADHKGKTIAAVLLDCLADWKINKVFTITLDNATANSSALRRFQDKFKCLGSESMVLGGEFLHMRCAAQILNLVVKDGLKEVDSSVEAIRNGITYMRSSTERMKSFELRVDSGRISRGSLPLDVRTRWNSTYLMLSRGLKFRIAFDKMEAEDRIYCNWFNEKVDGEKRIGPPSNDDWEAVDRLVKFLRIFYHSTLVVSASESVNAHRCYTEIVTIERNLKLLARDSDETMRDKAEGMRAKFDKYWEGLKQINKLLIVASVLDPTNKMCFATLCFEELYGKGSPECVQLTTSVTTVLERLFEEYVATSGRAETVGSSGFSHSQSTGTSSHSTEQDQGIELDDDCVGYERMDSLYKKMVTEKGLQETSTELELYLKESVVNPNLIVGTNFDILSWWRMNAAKYPTLVAIARDVFAMQVSSVASESAFSKSGRVLDPYRSCLTHFTIEVFMCTEQWLKSSIQMKDRGGETTTQQILQEIEIQDQIEREFSSSFNH